MDLGSFIEGVLLRAVFAIFALAVFSRIIFFVYSIIRSRKDKNGNILYIPSVFVRFLAPFHSAFLKKPIYASLRYIFHICLFVVPIWLAGHISMWEDSRSGWSWTPIPDAWADWMTLTVIAFAVFFTIRHFATKDLRSRSSIMDYAIIFLAAFPFLTGYGLTHGTYDTLPFIGDNIWTIHIFSGEMMIFAAAFILCRTRMDQNKCTGCASCVLNCPTGTLESRDSGKMRIFSYSHYQCISCGSCVDTCPEGAAELRHEINFKRFFNVFAKEDIRQVELEACKRCGKLFVPEPLMGKIHRTFHDEYLDLCPDCRKVDIGDHILRFSPIHHKPRQKINLGAA
ncbi:MAG: 4Fe-4S binding protein [Deltaproteobacteria bacterium]|nr:4Fe-4S binding protein [Deltaproteobacteria bacterium]